jgi:hypothetical protein
MSFQVLFHPPDAAYSYGGLYGDVYHGGVYDVYHGDDDSYRDAYRDGDSYPNHPSYYYYRLVFLRLQVSFLWPPTPLAIL